MQPLTKRKPPFLKWPGGKRWLWPYLKPFIPRDFRCYFEPFLGGGAIFFSLTPTNAVLADINAELITTYLQIRDNLEVVQQRLHRLRVDACTYEEMRASAPKSDIDIAVRLIYLNKTAFNGIYRVNHAGHFNVPFGRQLRRPVYDPAVLKCASSALRHSQITVSDFEHCIAMAGSNDVVYCDPPYTTLHDNNGFLRYNERLFSWKDQVRLAAAARDAVKRGACVIISNARTAPISKLYKDFRQVVVHRTSCVAAKTESRGRVSEALFLWQLK